METVDLRETIVYESVTIRLIKFKVNVQIMTGISIGFGDLDFR